MNRVIKAAVIGGSGFTGLELIKILVRHKYTRISIVTSNTYRDLKVSDVFKSFNYKSGIGGSNNLVYESTDNINNENLNKMDVVFLCLPPLKSMSFVKSHLFNYQGVIIDIGSDFRIKDPDDYKVWYGKEHKLKGMLPGYVYGLPEIYKDKIIKSKRIANPGCYPTSVLLSLAPVITDRKLKIDNIIIDTKSGISGAGRKLKKDYLYCNLNENFLAYSPNMHRHIGEIEQEIKNLSKIGHKVSFTPHLLPISRGIFTSIYCRINNKGKKGNLKDDIIRDYDDFYKDCIFIRFLKEEIPELKDVTGTNYCQIGITYDYRTDTLKVFSAIDNLLKGAAGQAVQNMNLVFNYNEGEALDEQGIFS